MSHVLVKLALIGFLCRALVPVGFMPAPISDGGPIRFCHGGGAGALLSALLEHRADARSSGDAQYGDRAYGHHGDVAYDHHGHRASGDLGDRAHEHGDGDADSEQNANHEGWERCPIGTAFAFAVLSYDFSLPLLALEHTFTPSDADLPIPRLLPAHYHARAPPRV